MCFLNARAENSKKTVRLQPQTVLWGKCLKETTLPSGMATKRQSCANMQPSEDP